MSGSRREDAALEGPPSELSSDASDFTTGAAMQWLAAMDDIDASDDERNSSPVTPVTREEIRQTGKLSAGAVRSMSHDDGEQLHKRGCSEEGSASGNGSSDGAPYQRRQKKRPKRKHRKSTIDIRKEEIARLLKELAAMHTRMEELNARAMAPCCQEETPSEAMQANKVLRRAIRKQQLEVTRMHGLMSEYSLFSIGVGSPIHRPIHLLKDTSSRHALLTAMKHDALQAGARFLRDRRPDVDPCKPMHEDHGFEAANGDFYATYFSTTQFENNVKQVFDILVGYFSSIEICVSEKLGNVTIREDDDNLAPGVTLNRLISTTIGGLRMESNTVYFSHYEGSSDEVGHEAGYGIFVADFVDQDERSPYHPHERIRRDFSAVLELTSYPIERAARGVASASNGTEATEEGRVVVLTRWVHSKVHHPQYRIPLAGWHEMRENTERWIQTLHHAMLERYFSLL